MESGGAGQAAGAQLGRGLSCHARQTKGSRRDPPQHHNALAQRLRATNRWRQCTLHALAHLPARRAAQHRGDGGSALGAASPARRPARPGAAAARRVAGVPGRGQAAARRGGFGSACGSRHRCSAAVPPRRRVGWVARRHPRARSRRCGRGGWLNRRPCAPAGVQLQLCECERAVGPPNGLGCGKEGWFISNFENQGTWVSSGRWIARAASSKGRASSLAAPTTAPTACRARRWAAEAWCRCRTPSAAAPACPTSCPLRRRRCCRPT